jgi:hypothetical protein
MSRPIEKRRIVVGCDLDDVLAAFMPRFIDMARAAGFGPDNDRMPIDWAWSNMGWTKEQEDILWQQLADTEDFWTCIGVMPHVDRDLVMKLWEKTVMYFPTARAQSKGHDVGVQSASWLRWQFGILFPTVIVSNEKGPLAAALKYDYFLDDRPKNCYEVKRARPECKVYLCNSSHNCDESTREYCAAMGIERIAGFNEFAKLILEETNDGSGS